MNTRWLTSFIAVAQAGSINKAAASQFISAQALTQQINLLEQEVGVQVFERTTKGVTLTPAGEALFDGAQRILGLWDATLHRCREAPSCGRSLVTPVCLAFASLDIEAGRREYQQTKDSCEPDLDLAINEEYKNWIDGLRDGSYDFIRYVRVGDIHPLGMYFEPVRELTAWCLMDPAHPLAGKTVIEPEELHGMRVATSDKRVVRKLLDVLEARGLRVDLHEIPVSRVHILDALASGSLCIFSKEFVHSFEGFVCAPINCPIENWEGLLCRTERAEELRHVFEILHRHMNRYEL